MNITKRQALLAISALKRRRDDLATEVGMVVDFGKAEQECLPPIAKARIDLVAEIDETIQSLADQAITPPEAPKSAMLQRSMDQGYFHG